MIIIFSFYKIKFLIGNIKKLILNNIKKNSSFIISNCT